MNILVNILGTLSWLFLILSLILLLIWIVLYIFKEKCILSERYFYKAVRLTIFPMIIFLLGTMICFHGKEHCKDKIDEPKSMEEELE
ncbi:TPA: hypothetical protein RXI60_000112 [Staphylococcus aureus]|nr:hypothetical protein [Staphylococcus aureus]HEA6811119.1 hypothetical protein [Staphylococcus aureus]